MAKSNSKKGAPTKQLSQQDYVIQIPDGGYGWVVLIASFFVSFILDGVMYSFGIILDGIKASTGEKEDICNLLSGFNTGFLFCSGPIVAGLANQFGCRAVVMGGGVVTAAMYMLTVFGPNVWAMLITYGFIGGLSTGCTYIASLIVIAEYFDKKRGVATGITMAGSGVGSFVFAPLIGYLIKTYDWKFTFSICACIILQTTLCGALMRPLEPVPISLADKAKQVELKNLNSTGEEKNEHGGEHHHHEEGPSRVALETYHGSVYSLNEVTPKFYERYSCLRITVGILKEMSDFSLLRQNLGFLLITLSNFFIFFGYFTPFLYITKIAEENGVPKEEASFLISIIGIVNIPARMAYGFIADRRIILPINLNTFSVIVGTVPLFLYFKLAEAYWSQVIFAVAFAIGIAGMNCLTTMYLVDLVGLKKFSNATGIINLFRGFGCFVGPFASGLISEKFGKVNCFFFSAICFSVGLVLTFLVSFQSTIKSCRKTDENDTAAVESAKDTDVQKNLLTAKA